MSDNIESLARDEADATAARAAIWTAVRSPEGYRSAYAALCRWTWRAMIERRLDDDLRDWHRLLLDAAAKIGAGEPGAVAGKLTPRGAAERMRALADLVRLSIDAAKTADAEGLAGRAHVLEILRLLSGKIGEFVRRDEIQAELGLGNANLSRVMSLLALNGLVEREARGRAAAFRVTQRALRLVDAAGNHSNDTSVEAPPPPPEITPAPESEKIDVFYSFVPRVTIRNAQIVHGKVFKSGHRADRVVDPAEAKYDNWLYRGPDIGHDDMAPASTICEVPPELVN